MLEKKNYKKLYTFWLPMFGENFFKTTGKELSIIERIRHKLRFYLEINRISEYSHTSNKLISQEEQEKDAKDKYIAFRYAKDADTTFSYEEFSFTFNSEKVTFIVDEFGFYFFEFEFKSHSEETMNNLINALFIEKHNDKDTANILSDKQKDILFSSLLNPDLLHQDFIGNKEKNIEKIKNSKLDKFLHKIITSIEIEDTLFTTQMFKDYQHKIENYVETIDKRLYNIQMVKEISSAKIEQSYLQDFIEEKALSNFLNVATSNSYLEMIQDSIQSVSSSLINKIYFLSTNENINRISLHEVSQSWQDEDIEQYIELANYSTASFKTIDRLISYAYYIKIGNKTSYTEVSSEETIEKNLSYSKWKISIEDFETKVKKSLDLLESHNQKKSYNELEDINRHQLSIDDHERMQELGNEDSTQRVGLSSAAMDKIQVFVSIFTALSVAVPISVEITKETPNFLGMLIVTVLILYGILNFGLSFYFKNKKKNEKITFPFIKLEYKSKHKLDDILISHLHHYDYNHEVFTLLKSENTHTIKEMIEEIINLLKIDNETSTQNIQIENAIIYRKQKLMNALNDNLTNINLDNDRKKELNDIISSLNKKELIKSELSSNLNKLLSNKDFFSLINSTLKILIIPREIKRHEYSHTIERINRYKHKILFRYSCKDSIDEKNQEEKDFTQYILSQEVKKLIKKDIKKSLNFTEEDELKNLNDIVENIHIKAVVTYSFEIKSAPKTDSESSSTIENFKVYKDYVKIYFSIEVFEQKKINFIKIRDIVHYHIANIFYEKLIHHMHLNEEI